LSKSSSEKYQRIPDPAIKSAIPITPSGPAAKPKIAAPESVTAAEAPDATAASAITAYPAAVRLYPFTSNTYLLDSGLRRNDVKNPICRF
jgi:hypothetical protein